MSVGQSGTKTKATKRGFGRVRKLPSGMYQAAFVGPDGVLYKAPQTFPAKELAEGWLGNEQMQIKLGAWQPPQQREEQRQQARAEVAAAKITLNEFADAWLRDRMTRDPDDKERLRPSTSKDYRTLLDQHILPVLGVLPVADITPEVVVGWHKGLASKKTPRARAKAYSLLTTIMNAAVADRTVPVVSNPCKIKGAGRTGRVRDVEPATLDELDLIAANMPERLRLAVLLAAWCALRYGEVFELRRRDVVILTDKGKPIAGTVKVRRGVVWVHGALFNDKPKTDAGVRDVAIPPHLLGDVLAHLKTHVEPTAGALLFTSTTGGNLRPSSFEVPWHKARKAAGREDLTFHGLRHTGATLAAVAGATIAELQGRLGHATPAMAMHYQHVAKDRDQAIAAALSALAGKSNG